MSNNRLYLEKATVLSGQLARIFGGISILFIFVGLVNIAVSFSRITFFQIGLVVGFTAVTLALGRHIHKQGMDDWMVMGLYSWGLASFFDWVLHVVLLLDINGVNAPQGLGWILGPMNYGFAIGGIVLQTEPWWYFVWDTGLIGGIVLAIGAVTKFPRFPPYRFIVWPFIGGIIKSFGYADFTRVASALTGGLISIRGVWSWTSLWTVFYNATLAPTNVPISYITVTTNWGPVFALFASLHFAAIWIAAVFAHRLHAGKGGYIPQNGYS